MSDDPRDAPAPPRDVLFVYGKTENDAYSVLRRRGDSVEVGALKKLEEGKPIHGEVVKLHRREEHPLVFDVDVVAQVNAAGRGASAQPAARSGPAQVATEAYRENWEAIFGDPRTKDPGELN